MLRRLLAASSVIVMIGVVVQWQLQPSALILGLPPHGSDVYSANAGAPVLTYALALTVPEPTYAGGVGTLTASPEGNAPAAADLAPNTTTLPGSAVSPEIVIANGTGPSPLSPSSFALTPATRSPSSTEESILNATSPSSSDDNTTTASASPRNRGQARGHLKHTSTTEVQPETVTPVTSTTAVTPTSAVSPTTAATSTTAATTTTTPATSNAVVVVPGDNLQGLVDSHPAGTTFLLRAGVYRRVSVVPKANDSFVGEAGAVFSGEGVTAHAFSGGANGVRVEGLVIERYAPEVQKGAIHPWGENWVIKGNEIRENTGAGLVFRSGFRVVGNNIHHNHQIGVKGRGAGALVEGNEIAFNNYLKKYEPGWEAGGTKFIDTTDLVVRNNYVHDNHGPGLWTDADNIRTRYEGNRVVNNFGPGILHEISYNAVIINNHVEGNAFGFYVGGILVANSSGVEVVGNVVKNNDGGVIGIQGDRGTGKYGPRNVTDLWVHNNTVGYGQGFSGVRLNITNTTVLTSGNNRFDRNAYTVSAVAKPFMWGQGTITTEQWKALGQDPSGSW
jgi:parallel beta-helix repeat protein